MPSITEPRAAASNVVVNVDQPWIGYDYLVKLNGESFFSNVEDQDRNLIFWVKAFELHGKLREGLADRVTHINIILSKNTDIPAIPTHAELTLGLVVEPSVALRGVDRGPPPEDKVKSKGFRALWGSKAELRRFKDGSILESVVWSSVEASTILQEIVSHLLECHFSKPMAATLRMEGNDFSTIIPGFNPALAVFDPVTAAYRILEQDIRTAQGLPLQIRQIRPASSALAYSSISLPFGRRGRPADPLDVVIQFEGSTRWPDDLRAIQMTKIAFLLKLEEILAQKTSHAAARISLENEHSDILNRSYLQVTYPSGAAFNVRIHHDREQTLIERLLKTKELSPKERATTATALACYKRTFESRPAHCQAVQVIATRYPVLTPTIRLVKRWFNAHMLGTHFPDELIEIITVRAFAHSQPWNPPSSPQTGLLRTILFLSRWDWQNDPLLVDFLGNIKSAEMQTARTRFDAWRNIDPSMNRVALFAATNYDTDGTTWTEFKPAKVIASRMTSLAIAANKAIQLQGHQLYLPAIFQPSTKGYDFHIRLSKRFTGAKQLSRTDSKFKNMQLDTIIDNELVGYDPIAGYLTELQSVYHEVVVFFHDPNGGSIIAGVWNPSKGRRRWKINLPYSTLPSTANQDNSEVDVTVNRDAILSEMARLGGDLVESIAIESADAETG